MRVKYVPMAESPESVKTFMRLFIAQHMSLSPTVLRPKQEKTQTQFTRKTRINGKK